MFEIARAGAREERDTHAYTNRTFRLQSSTSAAILAETYDMASVELAMRMNYASYILEDGWSDFDVIAAITAERIFRALDNL